MVYFGYISFRIFFIKFKFSRVKACVVVWYGPNEGDGEERDRFWNDMDRTLDSIGNEYEINYAIFVNVPMDGLHSLWKFDIGSFAKGIEMVL